MMDISSRPVAQPSNLLMGKPENVSIAAGPLSLWIRLAVLGTTTPEHAVHNARLRTITDFEIVLQVEGHGWIWSKSAGGSLDVHPGDLIFFPPDHVHGWAYEAGTHLAIHFDFHAHPELEAYDNLCPLDTIVTYQPAQTMPGFALHVDGAPQPIITLPMIISLRQPALWRERLEPLVHLWHRHSAHTFSGQLLVQETLAWALRELAEEVLPMKQNEQNLAHQRIHQLLNALDITSHLSHLSVVELAQHIAMGETAFRAAFFEVTGHTPHRYLEKYRIGRAARALIETNRTITRIARMEGYEDPYHFSRVFKRITGKSPTDYRSHFSQSEEREQISG